MRATRTRFGGAAAALVIAAVGMWLGARPVEAAAPAIATVSFLQGGADHQRGGTSAWAQLAKDGKLFQGDRIRTKADGRLEAKLADGSMLRLGPNSELGLDQAQFNKKTGTKKVKAKLFVGRMWAAVTKMFGGNEDSSFEVTTDNAVAGVRGTRFETARDASGGTQVKVYGGKVLVSNQPIYAIKGHTKSKRVEVAGPQEISKQQWEELVAGAMQMIQVAASGEMTKPQNFELAQAGGADDWESWNAERDRVAGLQD